MCAYVCEREGVREIQRISLELFTFANLPHRLHNYELNCLLKGEALISPSHSVTLFPIQFLHR